MYKVYTNSYMDHLITSLKGLGLSDKEALIYLALLQLGPSTPYRMAKRAKIKRPTAYVIAEELLEKGFIVQSPAKKYTYIARAPEILFDECEKRLQESQKHLSELKSLGGGVAEKPSVLYFDGSEGVRQALFHRVKELHGSEVFGFYANAEYMDPTLIGVTKEFNEYCNTHDIRVRGIVTDSNEIKKMGFEKYFKLHDQTFGHLTAKIVPKDMYSSNASFEFYPDFIKIIFYDTAIALIIESPTVAKAMRQIFQMLWLRIGETEFNTSNFVYTDGKK